MRRRSYPFGEADPGLEQLLVRNNPGAEKRKLVVVYRARANQAPYVRQAVGLLSSGGLTPYLLDDVFSMAKGGGFKMVRVVVAEEEAERAGVIIAAWVAEGSARIREIERRLLRKVGLAILAMLPVGAALWGLSRVLRLEQLLAALCAAVAALAVAAYLWGKRGRSDSGDDATPARPGHLDTRAARRGRSRRARRGRDDAT